MKDLTEITITTLDRMTEVTISYYPRVFRFTIKPYGEESDVSETRHFAFANDAITALENRGYFYAPELVWQAMDLLPKMQLMQQLE